MTETTWNLRFDEAGLHFRYKMIDRALPKLVVFFPSLRPPSSDAVEFYNRLTWAHHVNASCLFVADPGLKSGSDVRGTWFQGNADVFAAESISRQILLILKRFGLSEENCVLYGSSQGGFASMAVGAFMPAATVLAECPQTDVARYVSVADVNRAAKACYGVETMDDAPEKFSSRIRLADLYKACGHIPRSTILLKRSDAHHIHDHLNPFLDEVGDERVAVEMFEDFESAGHTPLPKDLVVDRLNSLC